MKNYFRLKLFTFFLLSISTILLLNSPLISASDVPMPEHKQIITQYIKDIRTLQEQILSLLEKADTPPSSLNAQINFIYNNIEDVEKSILNYVTEVPKLSPQRQDLLLSLVALNATENSLYQLTQFINETSLVEKTLLLEDFYFLRTSANDTLNRLENIISRQ